MTWLPSSTPEEQREQGRRLAEARSRLQEAIRDGKETGPAALDYEEARRQIVRSHLRLVGLLVRPYAKRGMPFADLMQEGSLGLMRAADLFEPDRGVLFSTYARWWVRHAVLRAVADLSGPMRIPVPMLLAISRLRRASSDLCHRLGRPASLAEVARASRVPMREATRAYLHGHAPVSLDSDADWSVAERLPTSNKSAAQICYSDTQEKLEERVRRAMGSLPGRQRQILELRFGLAAGTPRSRREIARDVGVSAERVRQIEVEALRRLRDPNRWGVPLDTLL
jgi:RNA polymerase primary sigma factor